MPNRLTTVRFSCSICERKHLHKESAEKCERKGIAIPEFNQLEVAEYTGRYRDEHGLIKYPQDDPRRGRKVIVMRDGHRTYLKPTYIHEVPSLYEVDGGRDPQGGWWIERVPDNSLKKLTDFKGDGCPLCGSTEVVDSIREDYQVFTSLFPAKLPQLGAVTCKECPGCKRKFFTSEQRVNVERMIKRMVKISVAKGDH